MPTKDEVIEALRTVEDPELGMDIVDLGLLYDVEVDGPKVKVIHSLTSMGCPAGPMIQDDIQNVASSLEGVDEVEIELTWDPPWTPDRMSVRRARRDLPPTWLAAAVARRVPSARRRGHARRDVGRRRLVRRLRRRHRPRPGRHGGLARPAVAPRALAPQPPRRPRHSEWARAVQRQPPDVALRVLPPRGSRALRGLVAPSPAPRVAGPLRRLPESRTRPSSFS